VGRAGTKTLLAAIAAGVTGSKQIVDKNDGPAQLL
jgi:hypothetical protein